MSALVAAPTLSPLYRMQWEEAQQSWVLLYPEGMVRLNTSAAEILRLADGLRSRAQIVEALEARFACSGLAGDVCDFLDIACQQGWVTEPGAAP